MITNNNVVAKFEKVSLNQYLETWAELYGDGVYERDKHIIETIYNNISLPERSTKYSAGYDFKIPFTVHLYKKTSIIIPSGIRCKFYNNNYALFLYPRSGLGFKYRVSLMNTIGVVDADYYGSKNEGHILIKIIYDGYEEQIKPIVQSYNYPSTGTDDEKLNYSLNCLTSTIVRNTKNVENIQFNANDKFIQGIFMPYGIIENDNCNNIRISGFGSTDNNNFIGTYHNDI